MLVQKTSEVSSIKFLSGEEIISKVISKSDNKLTLYAPLMFVLSQEKTPEGKNNVMFAPWMVGIDLHSTITINEDMVLAISKPSSLAEEQYLEAIGEKNAKTDINS